MRLIASLILLLVCFSAYSQNLNFQKNFMDGVIVLPDSTEKVGKIKWQANQYAMVIFENGNSKEKYSPDDILGFRIDSLKFNALHDLEVFSDNYIMIGQTTKVKYMFGQLISESDNFKIYLLYLSGYNAISGTTQIYPNIYFEKKAVDGQTEYVAFPYGIRMRDKKYEKAKEGLISFFEEYPDLISIIQEYKKEDDFDEIIEAVKSTSH